MMVMNKMMTMVILISLMVKVEDDDMVLKEGADKRCVDRGGLYSLKHKRLSMTTRLESTKGFLSKEKRRRQRKEATTKGFRGFMRKKKKIRPAAASLYRAPPS